MATVTKNFRIKSGLVVEGTTGTINGHNILTESTSGDQYILNLIGGETLVKSVSSELSVNGSGQLSIDRNVTDDWYDASGSASSAESNANSYTDTKIANSGGNYLDWNGQQLDVDTNGIAQAFSQTFDSYGSASTAETNAINHANSRFNDYTKTSDLDVTIDGYGYLKSADLNGYATETYVDQAEIDAKAYADSLINDASTTSTNSWSAYKTSTEIGLAQAAAELHADNAVAALVDGAPALLDTLNELAAAINDNPNYATDVANLVAGKQDTLTAGNGIGIDGSNNISVNIFDFIGNANDPAYIELGQKNGDIALYKTNLTNYTDTLYDVIGAAAAAQTAAEATAQAALDNVLDATTPFTDLNINDVAKQVAARTTSLGSVAVTAYQFNKSSFKSGKFLIKIDNGTNNEVSEILVTLDSSDNVAITEYAIVGTNGTRGTITADVDSTHCRIRVTPVDDSTITVAGTVFKA